MYHLNVLVPIRTGTSSGPSLQVVCFRSETCYPAAVYLAVRDTPISFPSCSQLQEIPGFCTCKRSGRSGQDIFHNSLAASPHDRIDHTWRWAMGTRYLPNDSGTKSAGPKNFSNSRPCDLGLHHGHICPCTSISFSRVFASWLLDLSMAQYLTLRSSIMAMGNPHGKPPIHGNLNRKIFYVRGQIVRCQ